MATTAEPGAVARALHALGSRVVHNGILELVAGLDDELVGASSGPTAPPIGFHVWHMARWADVTQADLPPALQPARHAQHPGTELWFADGWGTRFGRADAGPGVRGTGMQADPAELADLPFSDRALLLGYATAAFSALDAITSQLDEGQLATRCVNAYGYESSVAFIIVGHISHASRHLGSIEALIGLTGRPGTASV